jgi:hypothetical protein
MSFLQEQMPAFPNIAVVSWMKGAQSILISSWKRQIVRKTTNNKVCRIAKTHDHEYNSGIQLAACW